MSVVYGIKVAFRNIRCSMVGHRYVLVRRYDSNVQKLTCTRCHKVFGINHQVKAIVEWDDELNEVIKLCYPDKFTAES